MPQIATRKLTLLVVDDEPAIPRMLTEALKEPGLKIMTATQGDKAIEIFRENAREIDLVLLDLQMYPTNGLQILDELRKIDPNVRAAFMSGSPSEGQLAKILEEGSVPVFSKPFMSLADLSLALHELMEK